jgi:VanZ family protein
MESTSRRRWKLVVGLSLVTALYWLGMFIGTHLPVVPDPNQVLNSLDKLEHLSAFAGLAILLCSAGTASGVSTLRLRLWVIGLIAVYGAFDERTQAFVPHREPDVRDWIANMLGGGLGIAAFSLGHRLLCWIRARPADLS